MAAIDRDRNNEGRLILGLGSSISSWTSGIFGTPEIKPLSHLRDTISAIRHIEAGAHLGLEPFEGVYYKANFEAMIQRAPPYRKKRQSLGTYQVLNITSPMPWSKSM